MLLSLSARAGGRLMIIDMGGGTVDMTIHNIDMAGGDAISMCEATHRECLAEVSQPGTVSGKLCTGPHAVLCRSCMGATQTVRPAGWTRSVPGTAYMWERPAHCHTGFERFHNLHPAPLQR